MNESDKYREAIAILNTCRFIKSYAFLIFLLPIALFLLTRSFNLEKESVWGQVTIFSNIIVFLFSIVLYGRFRNPTPRIDWSTDLRLPILVLRSFNDTRIKHGEIIDSEYGPLIQDNYVNNIGQSTWEFARIILIQEENDSDYKGYHIFVESNDKNWEQDVIKIAEKCWAIIIFISDSKGVLRELELMAENDLLWKTVIFMPPSASLLTKRILFLKSFINYQTPWNELRNEFKKINYNLPEYNSKGMLYLPNKDFSIKKHICLDHNENNWHFIFRLIDPDNYNSSNTLNDILPINRSRESTEY